MTQAAATIISRIPTSDADLITNYIRATGHLVAATRIEDTLSHHILTKIHDDYLAAKNALSGRLAECSNDITLLPRLDEAARAYETARLDSIEHGSMPTTELGETSTRCFHLMEAAATILDQH